MSGSASASQTDAAGSTERVAESAIVVGYYAKPEGRAALARSIEEARLRGSRLIVVHTSPEHELAEMVSQLDASGVPYEIATPANDLDPGEELVATAERVDADFIVIGLRRRSPVGKLLLGSNAQRVLLDASCAVLAVKAE